MVEKRTKQANGTAFRLNSWTRCLDVKSSREGGTDELR